MSALCACSRMRVAAGDINETDTAVPTYHLKLRSINFVEVKWGSDSFNLSAKKVHSSQTAICFPNTV